MRLAIFDFDGTINQGETVRLFLKVLAKEMGRERAVRHFYLTRSPAYLLYKLGIARLAMMGAATRGLGRVISGMNGVELAAFYASCAGKVRVTFNPVAVARLRSHLEAGDTVVLLSGAFAGFLATIAKELGVEHSLGSEVAMADGRCGGYAKALIGGAKVEALNDWLRERDRRGEKYDLAEAWAYADGRQDLPLLRMVGQPVAVNPEKGLRKTALKRGWEII